MRACLAAAVAVTLTAAACRAVPPPPVVAPAATIQEIMEGIVVPSSTAIFESVGTFSTASGTIDRAPSSTEQWEDLERHAYILIEAANLLAVRGRQVERVSGAVEPSGESPEVPPAEIEARISRDPAAWDTHLEALRAIALRTQKVVHDRSIDGLFEVGGDMDLVCERCHQAYWYRPLDGIVLRR